VDRLDLNFQKQESMLIGTTYLSHETPRSNCGSSCDCGS